MNTVGGVNTVGGGGEHCRGGVNTVGGGGEHCRGG